MEARDERRLLNPVTIDELGFVPLSSTGAELLFEVFSQRYERGSILVTTNLSFDEWTRSVWFGTAHRRAAGPAYSPRPHPGDERRELPAQVQPGERPGPFRRRVARCLRVPRPSFLRLDLSPCGTAGISSFFMRPESLSLCM